MKTIFHHPCAVFTSICLTALAVLAPLAQAAPPDLTAAGAIAALKADNLANANPSYGETYNLGPTGLRGWIYIDRNNAGSQGLMTAQSRQILITVVAAGSSSAGVLAVDDVILGAKADGGNVPAFSSDCRKAMGWAISEAETKANGGVLSLLRWRAGTTSTVTLTLPVMGTYSDSAPYECEKSARILAGACKNLVSRLITDPGFLKSDLWGAINGLALMAGVVPGDPDYDRVQASLRSYARALAKSAPNDAPRCETWHWGYINLFLSEYYLHSVADGKPDAVVLEGVNRYTLILASFQSKYGTFGHGGVPKTPDGRFGESIPSYGPVNAAGIPANVAIVMGKKALLAGSHTVDPKIDLAIKRSSNFFAWFTNKGPIPYGEHEPYIDANSSGHASNGKDAMCAVLFGLQPDRPAAAEYFARMTIAGFNGREYGHTGQGFSFLWGAMGANMGGPQAAAAYLKKVRWHLDMLRRSDGSFVYEGEEQYGAGKTEDGTYFGATSYNGLDPTATYILTYALPLKRLLITGKDAIPAHVLSAEKVAKSIAAGTFKQDCTAYGVEWLMAALGDYDPVVRHDAAKELAARTLTPAEEQALIALAEGKEANARMGACQTLGIRKTASALPALGRRLSDDDLWVRGIAAKALNNFGSAAASQLTPMLKAFSANATDLDTVAWNDPLQLANGFLSFTLFGPLVNDTLAAERSLLYPAMRAGLRQPSGMARGSLGNILNRLSLEQVRELAPELVAAVVKRAPADNMFSEDLRFSALDILVKHKVEEGIPLCVLLQEESWHSDQHPGLVYLTEVYRGAAKDALPTLKKWQANLPKYAADSSIGQVDQRLPNMTSGIAAAIAAIESDTNPPELNYFKTIKATADPAAVKLPQSGTRLKATVTDVDGGTPKVVWTKVSGPGAVIFTPAGPSTTMECQATFVAPGTYVIRASAIDGSILDHKAWSAFAWGYIDLKTHQEILGAVTSDLTITVGADSNRGPRP